MKKTKIIGNILIGVGLVFLLIALMVDHVAPFLSIVGIVIACIGFLYFFAFWRCSFCHRHLPFHGMMGMVNCPYCGNKIDA